MCERKAKKDAPAAVVSRAACVSRAPPADASRPALAGWGRPAWSLRVNLLSTISIFGFCFQFFVFCFCCIHTASTPITSGTHTDGGAGIRTHESAWLEGTPAMSIIFMFCMMIVVLKSKVPHSFVLTLFIL